MKRTVIASILDVANSLDLKGFHKEADSLTMVARNLSRSAAYKRTPENRIEHRIMDPDIYYSSEDIPPIRRRPEDMSLTDYYIEYGSGLNDIEDRDPYKALDEGLYDEDLYGDGENGNDDGNDDGDDDDDIEPKKNDMSLTDYYIEYGPSPNKYKRRYR